MSVWGTSIKRTSSSESQEEKYLTLDDTAFKAYRRQFLNIPPTTYTRDKIKQGVELGIPLEYFVDADIVTEDNLYSLDFDSEFLKKFLNYIRYKNKINNPNYVEGSEDTVDQIDATDTADTKYENTKLEDKKSEEGLSKINLDKAELSKIVPDIITVKDYKPENKVDSNIDNVDGNAINKEETTPEVAKLDENIQELDGIDDTDGIVGIDDTDGIVDNTTNIYSQDDVDLIRKEMDDTFETRLKLLEETNLKNIKKLDVSIRTKDETIAALERKLKISQDNNSNSLNKLAELRKELMDAKEEVRELNNTIYKLNQIKNTYDLIKDDYIVYKEYYSTQSKIMEKTVREHKQREQELMDNLKTVETERNNIQEVFNEFYSSNGNITIDHTSNSRSPLIYFKMYGEPKYFYSMVKHLETIINNKGLKLLIVSFKNPSITDTQLYREWINLKDLNTVEDAIKHNGKIFTESMDRVMATKLDAVLDEYNIVIVLDYILNSEKQLIISPLTTEINVVKNTKQQELLGIYDNILSEDNKEIIDISHDEQMLKYNNPNVKAIFYGNRLRKWLDSVINKEIKM